MGFIQIQDENLQVYQNLSQAYEAEFSPLTGSLPNTEGLYPFSTTLDEWHQGYLYYDGEIPVGFVMVNIKESPFDLCEFYVLPSHRYQKIGHQMAFFIFDTFKGAWQIKQIEGATQAKAFWQSVIKDYTQGHYKEEAYL